MFQLMLLVLKIQFGMGIYLLRIVNGYNITKAIEFCNLVASIVIQKIGVQTAMCHIWRK